MTEQSSAFLLDDQMQWEDLGSGVQRQIMGYNGDLMMVKVKFETGAVGVQHQHIHTQVTHVHSGVFEATIDGKVQRLKTGDGFYAEPMIWHGVVCLEAGILIDSFSPVRLDFLEKQAK